MKTIKLIAILSFISIQTVFSQNWKPVTTSFGFMTKMLGVKVEGKFSGFQGSVIFDPEDLAKASISGTVEANSVDTENNLRNNHLKEKQEFFEVVKFPKIKMVSTKIEKNGKNYLGTFNLTIKSTTKALTIPFSAEIINDKIVLKGNTTINRKDWKIGGNTFGMTSDVVLNLTINAVKQ